MKRPARLPWFLLVLFLSACASQAAPTMGSQDLQTAVATPTFTAVAQIPATGSTATPALPTETMTLLPMPTDTSLPSPTVDLSQATATSILVTATTATSIPQRSSAATGDACDKPLTSWKGPTANFSIYNETKPEGRIVLSLYVVTPLGECGSLADLSAGPIGYYSARAFVDGKKDFKVYGGFQIKEGTWKIVVRNDKIIALGSCYPSC